VALNREWPEALTILNRLYASGGDEVIIDTLQITVGGHDYWLTRGWDDVTVTLENGAHATFLASAIDVALPARADGTQDLKFAISNIEELFQQLSAMRWIISAMPMNLSGAIYLQTCHLQQHRLLLSR
jgi:hypothetical protein